MIGLFNVLELIMFYCTFIKSPHYFTIAALVTRNGENISAVGQRAFVMKLVVLCTIVLSKVSGIICARLLVMRS
jgi:hypothetical protein